MATAIITGSARGIGAAISHGERGNLKITTADDLPIAEAILLSRASREENL